MTDAMILNDADHRLNGRSNSVPLPGSGLPSNREREQNIRGFTQDLVGSLQRAHRAFKRLQLLTHLGRDAAYSDQYQLQAFHPLRRAADGNVLMAQGFARAYGRLYESDGEAAKTVMEDHAHLLFNGLDRVSLAPADVESVTELLPDALRRTVTGRSAEAHRGI